jgi:hypothetical protein
MQTNKNSDYLLNADFFSNEIAIEVKNKMVKSFAKHSANAKFGESFP